ncbi:MAG: iron ABC transporter permease [Gemmatimonadaceae bacterium]|nr:iron ABC transporter permease [Gemmatimonadaceae bacterium]
MSLSRWLALGAALLLAIALAVSVGTVTVPLREVFSVFTDDASPLAEQVVWQLRLPRAVLAACVGAGLGLAGAALQGALRNALAEPYLLGVSGGAAVGGVVAYAVGLTALGLLPVAAFLGALAAVSVVVAIARVAGGRADARLLVMSGVVVGAGANAAVMVALANVPPDRARGALWWMMGSAADATWPQVGWLVVYLVPTMLWLWRDGRTLDVLALGDEPAAALGADVASASRRVFLLASLVAAATVAAAGLVGFVGLVVPHLSRSLGARVHRVLLPASALVGATVVVLADIIARTVASPADIPLGAVTALVGVPFFLLRIRRVTT